MRKMKRVVFVPLAIATCLSAMIPISKQLYVTMKELTLPDYYLEKGAQTKSANLKSMFRSLERAGVKSLWLCSRSGYDASLEINRLLRKTIDIRLIEVYLPRMEECSKKGKRGNDEAIMHFGGGERPKLFVGK